MPVRGLTVPVVRSQAAGQGSDRNCPGTHKRQCRIDFCPPGRTPPAKVQGTSKLRVPRRHGKSRAAGGSDRDD